MKCLTMQMVVKMMKGGKMKKVRWLFVVVLLFAGGCLPATQQEIQVLTGEVSRLLTGVDALQDATKQLTADGLVNAETVEEINDSIDTVQEHIETVVAEVEKAEDPIGAISRGWDASKPFNPYYGYGAAVLAVLRVLQLGKQKKETDVALEEVVVGVEKSKQNGGDLKKAFLASESVVTMDKVAAIRNRLV